MVEAYKRLDYLDLEIKPFRQIRTEQFDFPCFFKSSVEHLVHSESAPQLNFIYDTLILILQNLKERTGSSLSNKYLREINDKLEYLRNSRNLFGITSKQIENLVVRLEKLEVSLEKLNEKIQSLL